MPPHPALLKAVNTFSDLTQTTTPKPGSSSEIELDFASGLGHKQEVIRRQNVQSSSTSSAGGISASDFIQQAENHWSVSAASILAAWGGAIIVLILCILVYSAVRRRLKLIYQPRLKLRKRSKTPEEKEYEKALLKKEGNDPDQMTKVEKKEWKRQRHKEKPIWYPEGETAPGEWISRAPRDELGYLEWLKPSFKETAVELKSIIPIWCRRLLSYKGNKEKIDPEPATIFDQDVRLLEMLGLDAVVHLLFLRLLKYLFTVISFLAVLLALANYYINTQTTYGSTNALSTGPSAGNQTQSNDSGNGNGKSARAVSGDTDGNGSQRNILENPALLTAANIKSNGLLVHISFEVIVTLLVLVFVLKVSAHHLKLVQEWTHMNYNDVSFKTLMLTNLAILYKPEEGLLTISDAHDKIKKLVLGTGKVKQKKKGGKKEDEMDYQEKISGVASYHALDARVWFAVHNMNPLHEKVEKFKEKYFKNALNAVALETFYGQGKGVFYDSCKDMICGRPKPPSKRVSEAVDEKREIEAMQEEIRQDQKHVEKTDLTGTVTSAFITVPTAKDARNILKDRREALRECGYHLERAPRSHNVLWKNLEQDAKHRHSHAATGKMALWALCFLNTIPVMLVVLLTNVGTAIERFPKLGRMRENSQIWSAIFTFLQGVLPAIVAAFFSYLLPYAMRRINKWSGALTRGQLDKAVVRQLFIFLLISNFIVFSLLGVLYETYLGISSKIHKESWSAIYASLGDLPAKVTRAYISESLFWLSWYPIRSIVMWLQLLQIPRLLIKLPKLIMMKTPDDLAEVAQSITFETAIECSYLLFATVVGLVYAPLAPLVVICAAVHFWSAHLVHSNSLRFVNDTKESDGACWKLLINRLLVATVLMHCMMVLTVALKTRSPLMATGSGLPIGVVYGSNFKFYLSKHYDTDGPGFSEYLDKYRYDEQGESRHAPVYKHDLLRRDWMPKRKTVKNEKLLEAAMNRFPKLKELFETPSMDEKDDISEKSSRRRRRRRKR